MLAWASLRSADPRSQIWTARTLETTRLGRTNGGKKPKGDVEEREERDKDDVRSKRRDQVDQDEDAPPCRNERVSD